jgi:hypothetical protein
MERMAKGRLSRCPRNRDRGSKAMTHTPATRGALVDDAMVERAITAAMRQCRREGVGMTDKRWDTLFPSRAAWRAALESLAFAPVLGTWVRFSETAPPLKQWLFALSPMTGNIYPLWVINSDNDLSEHYTHWWQPSIPPPPIAPTPPAADTSASVQQGEG